MPAAGPEPAEASVPCVLPAAPPHPAHTLRLPQSGPADSGPGGGSRVALPASFAGLVQLFEARHESVLAAMLHDRIRPVRYAPPVLEVEPVGSLPRDFAQRVAACVELWTGQRLAVAMASAGGAPTLAEQAEAMLRALPEDPALRPLFAAFPGARLLDFEPGSGEAEPAALGDASAGPHDATEERA
jgi:DNA polymerase-3 subunit gamma/tau